MELLSLGGQARPGSGLPPPHPQRGPASLVDSSVLLTDADARRRLQVDGCLYNLHSTSID